MPAPVEWTVFSSYCSTLKILQLILFHSKIHSFYSFIYIVLCEYIFSLGKFEFLVYVVQNSKDILVTEFSNTFKSITDNYVSNERGKKCMKESRTAMRKNNLWFSSLENVYFKLKII